MDLLFQDFGQNSTVLKFILVNLQKQIKSIKENKFCIFNSIYYSFSVVYFDAMAKGKRSKKNEKTVPARRMPKRSAPTFGPITSIDTAPVSIGNSLRGSAPVVTSTKSGIRVLSRDLLFECKSTVAAATDWSLIGGVPITPSVMTSTALRSYCQLYSKFHVNRLLFHYISSSPTSQAGDILFYYEEDRMSPMVDFTAPGSFLQYVLSNPNTLIGPQWKNHSIDIKPVDGLNSTDYGMNVDLNEESCGSLFIFSKTNSANSPGYIVVDYDIVFSELAINPRAGVLPIARGQWNYMTIGDTAKATTNGSTVLISTVQGVNPDGSTSAVPTGTVRGDIFKCLALVTNSTVSGTNAAWTNVTTANLASYQVAGNNSLSIAMADGFTFYASLVDNTIYLYPTLANALTSTEPFYYGVTATITWRLCLVVSLVGSIGTPIQSAY